MKNFLRTLKSEFRRIFSDRKLLLCTLAVLAGFLVVISVFLATDIIGNPLNYKPNVEYCQSQFEYYQRYYLYLTGATQEHPSTIIMTTDIEVVKERMEYFSYMVENGGKSYLFIDLNDFYPQLNSNPYMVAPTSRGAFAQLWIMNNMFYVLLFVAIVIAALICLAPYANGVMKNYYASPIKKSTLFAGKLTACWAMCLLCWLGVLVWGLCFGTIGEPVRVLYYTGDKYTSYALSGVFVVKMLGALIAMLVVSSLTAFIGKLSGKSFLPAAGVVLACVLFTVISSCEGIFEIHTPLKKSTVPITGLCRSPYLPVEGGLWGLYAFYIIVSAALFAASVFISRKAKNEN